MTAYYFEYISIGDITLIVCLLLYDLAAGAQYQGQQNQYGQYGPMEQQYGPPPQQQFQQPQNQFPPPNRYPPYGEASET